MTAGINHMAWFLGFTHKGEDLYTRMWDELDREGPVLFEQYRFEFMKTTGYFCEEKRCPRPVIVIRVCLLRTAYRTFSGG